MILEVVVPIETDAAWFFANPYFDKSAISGHEVRRTLSLRNLAAGPSGLRVTVFAVLY